MSNSELLSSSKIKAIAAIWFLIAVAAGAMGLLDALVVPLPQLILFGLILILLITFRLSTQFQQWSLHVNINVLILANSVRFIGVYFLILYSEGKLPYEFAVLGGWGDIIIAALALLLVLFVPPSGKTGWSIYLVWNLLGFIDILFVVATAGSHAMANPGSMSELLHLPLSLLPTFVVPIIIYVHIVIFLRLYRSKTQDYGTI